MLCLQDGGMGLMLTKDSLPLMIGEIDYANAWPLFVGLDQRLDASELGLCSRIPAELNRKLREGELQASAVSSYAYGLNSKDYLLLPELCVGSEGRVNSVLLFLKQPIEQVRPQRIAVTTASATSVNLLKIVMKLYYDLDAEYIAAEPMLDQMLESADGALIIGDPAIHASWRSEELHIIDLGELWHRWTGLGMTFAVVAVHKEAAAAFPREIHELHQAMLATKRHNLADLSPLVDKACEELGGERAYWLDYFTCLQYDFGQKLREGLALYFRYATQLGLLDHEVQLAFYEDNSAE